MKSILALALLLGGLLIGWQSRTQSPASRPAAPPPPMADYPPGSLGLRRHAGVPYVITARLSSVRQLAGSGLDSGPTT